MDGFSLHHYTVPGEWSHKGSATDFAESEWHLTMKKAAKMEELIQKHGAIMDEFDPEKRIGIIVDEWGTWFDAEPGTNPGFLYQQNTLRDALVAGINFNIFNNYAERVYMANIAQTINVLQAVILTEGAGMILTPTYHVFDMYKVHHDAVKLPVYVDCESVKGMPAISASASRDDDNRIHISMTNIDPAKAKTVSVDMAGSVLSNSVKITARIVTAEKLQEHNTFEKPAAVTLQEFSGASISGGKINVELPPASVVTLSLGN